MKPRNYAHNFKMNMMTLVIFGALFACPMIALALMCD